MKPMRIAFYAPMKPLDNPVPSGDRQMGRLICRALENAGHDLEVASRLRTWSRHGGDEQEHFRSAGEQETERLIEFYSGEAARPDLWLTYHLYHKAPDWIGPPVSDRLAIPYVVIEASRARKRRNGAWSIGFAQADHALSRASAVVALHDEDAVGLSAVVEPDRLFQLSPFIDTAPFEQIRSRAAKDPTEPVRLLTVAMMRRGDKETSYRILAEALTRLRDHPWTLTIVGDGDARGDILSLFPPERITWLGLLPAEEVADAYRNADIFVWPAVNEAFGLVFLEAQAAGLAIVAGRTGGVPDVVREGETGLLTVEGESDSFAETLEWLFDHPDAVDRFGAAGPDRVERHHSLRAGTEGLDAILAQMHGKGTADREQPIR